MKIELEVKDLELFAKAFNNAVITYGDIVSSIRLGCDPGLRLSVKESLSKIPEEELIERINILYNTYTQIEELERRLL